MNTKQLTRIALMTAVIAVLSPISVPLATLVPVSLATLAVMLAGAVLGKTEGALSVIIFLLLGLIGLPVFAEYSSGAGALFGVTGGFLFGYIPLAWLTGYIYEKRKDTPGLVLGMLAGNLVLYAMGTIWFVVFTGSSAAAALAACVLPFLPVDALKMFLVALVSPRIRRAVGE